MNKTTIGAEIMTKIARMPDRDHMPGIQPPLYCRKNHQMKGAIIYQSRYGATQQYAGWIGSQLHLPVFNLCNISAEQLEQYDYLLIGTSVYIGKMLIKDWLKHHAATLQYKKLFLFVVCATPSSERQKQLQIVKDNVPDDLIAAEEIFFLPGRLKIHELTLVDRCFLRMGAKLEKDKRKKEAMTHDIDAVKIENIAPFAKAVETFRVQAEQFIL